MALLTCGVALPGFEITASASQPARRDLPCAFEETYRNAHVAILTGDCALTKSEALEALGSVIVATAMTGAADNVIARVLGTGSKRVLGWVSVFADLQTGSDWVQNPLRVFPVARNLRRSRRTLKTILFPVLKDWDAPLSRQDESVGVLLGVDFLVSPLSRHYWHADWSLWLEVEYMNQPGTTTLLMTGEEVTRHIDTDRSHVLLLDPKYAFPIDDVIAGCPGDKYGCGVSVNLVGGDSPMPGVYRANAAIYLVEE